MTEFRSRTGEPMELMEWAQAYEDHAERIISRTQVGPYLVSTIWEGIVTPALSGDNIFETALLLGGDIVEKWRTPNMESALEMHTVIVTQTKVRLQDDADRAF